MISSRYGWLVAFFLAVALIPTVIHNYLGTTVDDGKSTAGINPVLGDFVSEPTNREAQWVTGLFGDMDWIERIYSNLKGSQIKLFVGRSFDHKRLYHHPELALSHGQGLENIGITLLPGDPEIPVHLLRSTTGAGLVAYVLLYDGSFVKEPILSQILDSFDLFFHGRKQMTIFYVSDLKMSKSDDFSGSPSATLLKEVIRDFNSQNDTL